MERWLWINGDLEVGGNALHLSAETEECVSKDDRNLNSVHS
jgi:hypothetical protein